MRRLTLRLIVGLLTFMIGVTAASLWLISRRSSPVAVKLNVNAPSLSATESKRTYERGPVAGESTEGSFTTFTSSDGMRFTKWSVYCGSPQRAKRELQKRLKKAAEIISREPVIDERGQEIGEKVVIVYSTNYPQVRDASLIWTEKEELFQVESSSLENILEYRKDFKR